MKSRRVFLFSTIISVCLCTVMTTPAFAVNWWQVGWIVANNVIDRVVNLDGQSSNDQYWFHLPLFSTMAPMEANSICALKSPAV